MLRSLLALCLILTAGVLLSQQVSAAKQQPNILWIIAEDMSQDQFCYGNSLVHTPNIDRLAAQGMRYTNMFTVAGVCAPSRSAIAVGMYQNSIGAMHMRYSDELKPELPGEVKTVSHILRDNGYQTFGNGKDDYMFSIDGPSFEMNDLDDLHPDQPFFAKINSHYTHRIFKRDSLHPIDPQDVSLPPYYPDVKPLRDDWAAYLENVQLLDREVGALLDTLAAKGLLEQTIFFFLSDHGSPTLRGKYWLYDSGTRIPFIVHIPSSINLPEGFKPGTVDNELHASIDISATTLALAGVPVPQWMEGRPFLGDQTTASREYVFGAADRIGGVYFKSRSVRSSQYRLIKNFNNGRSIWENSTEYRKARLPYYNVIKILDNYNKLSGTEKLLVEPMPLYELYDIRSDPYETKNLAYDPDYAKVRSELEQVLHSWINEIDDKAFYPDSEEVQEHFIRYRTSNQEQYREERLESYNQIKNQLIKEGKI